MQNRTSSETYGRSEALKVAIDLGDIILCTRLVQEGVDLNSGIDACKGCTALLYSLYNGQYAISKYLISEGATTAGSTCDMVKTKGYNAFHYAAAYGQTELLQLLLEKSPNEIHLDHNPVHPIHLAILQGNPDSVSLILDHISQGTISYSVMVLGCTDVTDILGKGRNFSDQIGTSQEALDRIVNVQVRDDSSDWHWNGEPFPSEFTSARPLHIAASIGNLQIVSMLLAHGAPVSSVDEDYKTPLHYAADHDRIAMVNLLLEAGANPNGLDWNLESPAMRAAEQGYIHCVRVLLKAGADIQLRNSWGETALFLAADSGAKDMFVFLMSKISGYELAAEDIVGRSVLYAAMLQSLAFPMNFLLSVAPSAAAYAFEGRNILNAAILYRSTIEVKMLLRRIPAYLLPGLLNQRDIETGTPLHTAAIYEKLDTITLLLDTGAQLEVEAYDHGTALMGACAIGRLASVKFLVPKGAKTSYMHDGQLYSAFVAAKNHPEVRRWLLVGRFVEGPRLLTYKEFEEGK